MSSHSQPLQIMRTDHKSIRGYDVPSPGSYRPVRLYPRIMTYGIDSSNQKMTEAAISLVRHIGAIRKQVCMSAMCMFFRYVNVPQCPTRSLFFFGHSLGGEVVKQVGCNTVSKSKMRQLNVNRL